MSEQTRTRPPGGGAAGVEDTVKDFWASRPRRPRTGRKIAGVAAGVGYRYGIDPVVVRVALVVTAVLGGVGFAAYLLGWLFFPDERDDVSAVEALFGRGRSSTSRAFTICLCVAAVPVLGWTFGGGWFDGGGLLGLALLVAALYLLHRSRGQHHRPADARTARFGTPDGAAPASFTHADVADDSTDDVETASTGTGESAPSEHSGQASAWDPLGAAPLAWDLPEPARAPVPQPPAPERPQRRRSKAGRATFGLALVVAGTGVALAAGGTPWFSAQHVIGLILGVLGLGMVTAAFAGGGRGLIGLAVPLSIAGVALTTMPLENIPAGMGNIERTPTSLSALQPSYQQGMGTIDIDLTELPPAPLVDLSVHVGLGEATVVVPTNADVTFTCSTGIGDVDCLSKTSSGIGTEEVAGTDPGPDGEGGQDITVEVTAGMGSVEVRRVP